MFLGGGRKYHEKITGGENYMSEVIYRKYRPSTFADVTDQDHVKRTIQNQIASGTVAHAYLFTGPRGVGKTTIARLLAKTVNCTQVKKSEPCNACSACTAILEGSAMDVIEIDAASHTDVENVRDNIIGNVRFPPSVLSRKVFIIDEVHMLSSSSFNALLKTLEEPPAHALFILATTEIHKVPETIISRCQRYDFKRVPAQAMVKRMQEIAKKEKREIAEDVLQEIARHSDGGMRDAESLLGQIFSLGEKKITMDTASLVLPATTTVLVLEFTQALLHKQAGEAVQLLGTYVEQGVDMTHFLDDVIDFLRQLLLCSLGDSTSLSQTYDEKSAKRAQDLLAQTTPNDLSLAITKFLEARRHSRTDRIPQLSAELAVMALCKQPDFKGQGVDSVHPAPMQTQTFTPPQQVVPPVQEIKEKEAETGELDDLSQTIQQVPVMEKKVFDTVPVISIDEVKRRWPEVFKQLQEENGTLPVVVQSGRLCDVCEGHVEISFDFEFHAEVVNKEKNRLILEKIMERVFGKPLRIRAKHEKLENDETVSNLLEEFGGSVV